MDEEPSTLMFCRDCARVVGLGETRPGNLNVTYQLPEGKRLMTGRWNRRQKYSDQPCPGCGDPRPGSRREVLLCPPWPSRSFLEYGPDGRPGGKPPKLR